MDRDSEVIANFESVLRNQRTKQLLGLYRDKSANSAHSMLNKSYSPSEILSNISKQICAIQNADTANNDRKVSSAAISKCKKTTFMPVNMLPGSNEVLHQKPLPKFETQGVSDTQLLNVVHGIEEIDPGGITQEFDLTFQHESNENDEDKTVCKSIVTSPFPIIDISLKDSGLKKNNDVKVTNTNHATTENTHFLKEFNKSLGTKTQNQILETDIVVNENEQTMNDITLQNNPHILNNSGPIKEQGYKNEITGKIECLNVIEPNTIDTQIENCTQIFNDCIEIENNDQLDILMEDTDIPLSPILDRKSKPPTIFSPLVFNLDTFESFEEIAVPAIEESPNLETAKQIINSQIIGKELLIHTNKKPLLTPIDLDILSTKKDDRISPIIHLDQDKMQVKKLDELLEVPKKRSDLKINFFEDEILFSSDEEADSDLKTVDLPFTCALETSFYEKGGVLDKTMYVGFHTASNKSIQICTDSFSKAIDILDFNKNEIPLKELVNLCESNFKIEGINSNDKETVIQNLKNNLEVDTDVRCFEDMQCLVTPYSKYNNKTKNQNETTNMIENEVMLLTKSELKVDVDSEDSIDFIQSQILPYSKQNNKSKKHNEKLKTEKGIVNLITTSNSTEAKTADVKPSEVFRDWAKVTSDCDLYKSDVSKNEKNTLEVSLKPKCQYKETNALTNSNEDIQTLRKFQTACNKRISLSEKAIERSEKPLQDISLKDTLLNVKSVEMPENANNNIINTLGQHFHYTSKDILIEGNNEFEHYLQSEMKHNLCENKEIFIITNKQKDNLSESSFQVDNKHTIKKFSVDRKLTDTVKIYKGTSDLSSESSQNNGTGIQLGGFKTASNKNIKISHFAVEKSKAIFQGLINEASLIVQDDQSGINKIMKTDKGKENFLHALLSPNNKEAIECNNKSKYINKHSVNKQIKSKDLPTYNNEVLVSKDTLLKINTVNDIGDGEFIIPVKSNKNYNNSRKNIDKCTDFYKSESDEEAPFYGFEHENNKEVRVFEEAMINCGVFEAFQEYPQKIKANKIDKRDTTNNFDVLKANFQGFRTASNKEVKISEKALIDSKILIRDIDNSDQENKNIPSITTFEGLQTARNKPVHTSVKALAKGKNIFEDILADSDNNHKYTNENVPSTSFQGFKTASNKPVKISVKALATSKKIFEDIDFDHENNKQYFNESIPTSFEGLQTASNELVTISAEALAKSKKIFQDINIADEFKAPNVPKITPLTSAFVVFQTANNKPVKISAEALAKTKDLFQDLNVVDIESTHENVPTSPKFHGFRTASNKNVPISAEALAKSKNMLQDIYTEPTVTENSAIDSQRFETLDFINSEEALIKSEKVFQDIHKTNLESKTLASGFQGFQTASNKEVKISKDALARTKKIFQNIVGAKNEEVIEGISSFKGFQTASDKDVKISEEALAKSKRICENIVEKSDFVEKGYKKVKICDEAFVKSKKSFDDIKLDVGHVHNFQGFQTASKKTINISTVALEKSKALFQDFDLKHFNSDKHDITLKSSNDLRELGYNDANYTKVQASNEAVFRSENLLTNLNTENKSDKILVKENVQKTKVGKNNSEIESIIDTQVISNFEESLHTEDFFKESTPKVSKRSGSPILSCPKAKRRKKFQIPYSQTVAEDIMCIPQSENPKFVENPKNITEFDVNYKKNKKYTLKDLLNIEKDDPSIKSEIDNYILTFPFEDLLNFEFFDQRNDISSTKLTTTEIKNIFMENVNTKLIPEGWLDIHLKLILWKLISYEIRFPKTMKGITTAKNILEQLKYRYNTELYDAKRPALRKIMEKDDTSYKTLVLCIVAVLVDGEAVTSIPQNHTNIELLLTDGWYCIKTSIDRMLSKLVSAGRLYAGCKIVTHGAEVTGCEQGVAPWEDTSSIRLKIYGNSTRRARWDARLGYHSTSAILTPLSSVMADGGKISKLRLFVTRVYPALYVEKFDDGSTVTRSERLEHLHQVKYETERQALMEKLYEEVEREMSDQDSPDSENMETGAKDKPMDSGSQIAKVMKRSADPADFRNHLTSSQTVLLQDHSTRERERLLQQIQTRVQDKMAKFGLQQVRNVVPLLKTRVVGVDLKNDIKITKAFLSIWKPNDAVLEIIKEGVWIEVLNTIPTAIRYSEIQISAGRHSVFNLSKYKEMEKLKIHLHPLKRTCYPIKDLIKNPSLTTAYNEIDTVGFIFLIEPAMKEFDGNKHQFQNVYLTDADKNMICVNFWAGLKKFGFENVLDTGQIVACVNLQKRAGNTRKQILQFRGTEFSYFTKTPKNEIVRNMLEDLSKMLPKDKPNFVEDCMNLRQNYAVAKQHCSENISPYRMANIDIDSSKNKIFLESPLHQKINKIDENLNLTGLDFESTFKQMETQELSPRTLMRKQQIKEKIARLKMYGEPPPLSPMQILNKSKNAGNAFKSPFSKSDVSDSVASKENVPNQLDIRETSDDAELQSSPVIMNRTYVKRVSINPVKLNFNTAEEQNNESEVIDEFGEEFDGSPPLSLE